MEIAVRRENCRLKPEAERGLWGWFRPFLQPVSFLQSTFNDAEPTPKTKGEVFAWARSLPMEPWQETLLDVMEEDIEDMEIYRCRLGEVYSNGTAVGRN